jgi:hypothetical protein
VQDAVAAFAVRDILNRAGGDVAKVPLVWYTGNPEGRMTEEAIKANQGLTADKYQKKWLSVLGGGTPAPTKTAQAPRTTAQGPKQMGARVASAFNPRDLPSSYTSALALNYLADTDPEGLTMSKVNEMLAEMIEDGGGAAKPAGGKILQQFAQTKSVDPFQFVLQKEEEPKRRAVPRMPKMFAEGGEASKERPEDDYMSMEEREEARRKAQAMLFNVRGNIGPVMGQFVPGMDGVDVRASTQAGSVRPYVDVSPNARAVTQAGVTYGNVGPQGGYEVEVSKRAPMQTPMGKINMPVTARGSYSAPVGKMGQVQAQGYYVPRQGQMPQSSYGANLRFVQRFQEGGEVDYNQMAEQMTVGTIPTEGQIPAGQAFQNVGRDIVRGAQYLPYDLAGAPVDIINLGLTPFGLGSDKPFMGSEYLIDKAAQAGIADRPTGSAAETVTRIGMGFVNPAAVARQGARGVESIVDIAKAPIDRARIQAAASRAPGEEAYAPLRERLESQGILSLATRPGGSVMFGDETSRNLLKLHLDQQRLDEYAQGEMPKAGAAFSNSFLNYLPKIDKYMQSQFSTPNDPLLIATVEGRFKPKPFLRPNDIFSYDRKEISRITEIPLQDETKLTPAHVNKLLELSKAGNEKAQKIVFSGASRSINTSGQITVPQIVDKLKNTEFFDEVNANLKSAVESTFWKELGKEEDIVPLMKKYISQKGVPNEQEQRAFNTLGFRVSTILEAKADAEKKLQAKNPLFGNYPTSIGVADLAETRKLNEAAENIPGMAEEISRGKPVYRYSTTWGSPFRTEDIFEYMSENDPSKWSKMSVPELIIASSAKDPASVTSPTKIARMADDGDPLTADQLRTGTQRYMPVNSPTLGEGAEWREITTKEGLRIEGGVLQHCLKRETSGYCNRLLNKESKYFTLRDADGQPYVSIELAKPIGKEKEDVPYSVIKQVKGFKNTNTIPLYGEEVSDFLMDWQKKSGVKLRPTEDNDFLPQKFKQKTSFGIETPPENLRKGGMVDKPLYDRAV